MLAADMVGYSRLMAADEAIDGKEKAAAGVSPDGEKNDRMAFQTEAVR